VTAVTPAERALNAANEMLAVNAETVGLLAERAPSEIGFAHAVFEEHGRGPQLLRDWANYPAPSSAW
jgi:hypothetical protein